MCTKDRIAWLAQEDVHRQLLKCWRSADAWLLGRYVIMTDHLHFFAGYRGSEVPFDHWVTYWKSQFSKGLERRGDWRWQANRWDVRVRDQRAYESQWNYILENPVRANIVKDARDWPFQGAVFSLAWD